MPESGGTEGVSNVESPNGALTRDIHISLEQADLAKSLLQAVNQTRDVHIEAQSKWEAFLVGVGLCSGDELVGGNLDSDGPDGSLLTVKGGNGIISNEAGG